MKTRCIIVEDEPIAVEIIEHYLKTMPDITIVAKCNNALEAFSILKNNSVDLMFLDIHMPQISGLEFLKSLRNPPKVILTTAHRKYALEGFDLNVVDYLLKPISLDRFMKAIDKYYHLSNTASVNISSVSSSKEEPFIYVKADRKAVKVLLGEIFYIESLKDYVVIHKKEQKIITKQQIGFFEQELPPEMFLRIHRSYIVAINKIEAVTKSSIEINKKELPISRSYKNEVIKSLKLSLE